MAQQRDDNVDPADGEGVPLKPNPAQEGRAPAANGNGGFLPDDSFLLDLDDELLAAPGDTAGEEFLLVDDEATAEVLSALPDAPAAASETSASEAPASEAPASETLAIDERAEGEDEANELAALMPAAAELAPIDSMDEDASSSEVAASAGESAADRVAPESSSGLEDALANLGADASDAHETTREEASMEELTAVAQMALGQRFEDGRRKERQAPIAPTAERMADPIAAAASEERAMAFAASDEPVAAQPNGPGWLDRDDGDLPAFVGDAEEIETALVVTAGASAADAAPPLAPLAPIVALSSKRRRWVAAAGMLLAAALTAALVFELDRRGMLGSSADGPVVATLPSNPLRGATPVAQPSEEPIETSEPPPVVTVESQPVVDASVPAEPAVSDTPPPAVDEPSDEPVVAVAEPIPAPPVAEPIPAPPVAELPPEPAPEPKRAPVAVERPDPVAADPRAMILEPPRKRPLALGSPTPRSQLEGADTIIQLENGHAFRGRIQRVRGTTLTLRLGSGECVFDLDEISLLDSSAPEYRRVGDMPEASVVLHNGQRMRGRLMKQTREHVVLVVDNGQVVFPRADVKDVRFTGRIHF